MVYQNHVPVYLLDCHFSGGFVFSSDVFPLRLSPFFFYICMPDMSCPARLAAHELFAPSFSFFSGPGSESGSPVTEVCFPASIIVWCFVKALNLPFVTCFPPPVKDDACFMSVGASQVDPLGMSLFIISLLFFSFCVW